MSLPALLANYINYGNGSSTGYYAVAQWAATVNYTVGTLVRPLTAPAVGNERVYVCTTAGISVVEPTWTFTRGALQSGSVEKFTECTGQPAVNGDLTNTLTWTASKAAASTPSLGVIVKDGSNNLFICTTSGAVGGSEPAWNTTVGNTTTDSGATWTCIRNGAYGAWAGPHARIANAHTANWGSAGDDFYVASASAETRSTFASISFTGTSASPSRTLCVNAAGSVPPVSADLTTGASAENTSGGGFQIEGTAAYVRGITFKSGTGSTGGSFNVLNNGGWLLFDNCALQINSTGSGATLSIGSNGNDNSHALFNNTTVAFGATGQSITVNNRFTWKNTVSATSGTIPTTLFNSTVNAQINLIGVDLSASGSGKNLFNVNSGTVGEINLTDCKLGSSVSITTGTVPQQVSRTIRAVNCDSSNTNYRYHKQDYRGTITHETTIVKASGASDGTNSFSRKMATTANSKFYSPLESDWCYYWNDATGSALTVAFATVTDNVTLKDSEAWIEVEGLGTASFPLGTFSNDAAADVLNAGTNQTTDVTSTWTTTGLGTPVKQTLSTTITPQLKGLIRARVCLAKATTTMYFDPKMQVS